MTKIDYKEKLNELSKNIPPEVVVRMRDTLKSLFEEEDVPYDEQTLKAARIMLHLVHPGIPPQFAEFINSSILILLRLTDELETGIITSPIQKDV